MSIYGHYSKQYYGNKITYPEESFLISGISFYKENCLDFLCKENIEEPLKIIHIKYVNGNYGIRVIPKVYYKEMEYE